jgi:Fe2+ transport system protein FeoA
MIKAMRQRRADRTAALAAQSTQPSSAEHRASCTALCCARNGDSVCVAALVGNCSEAARLREMGLCEGARVQVLRHGNPLVVRVADARLGLAHAVAERVMCVPVETPQPAVSPVV